VARQLIELTALSTGFDKLQYGTMEVSTPRLVLDQPVRWLRDPEKPTFSGALSLNAGQTRFSGGSVLPPSVLTFSVDGTDPTISSLRATSMRTKSARYR
jgi:hypothetical protein